MAGIQSATQFGAEFQRGRTIGLVLLIGLTLAACKDGRLALGSGGDAATDTADIGAAMAGQTTELVERDVEAPEIFQITEQGLWDGRPSLGGVWVAHPDVTDPERVIIRNTENGSFVIGALFRRERDNPGPALQVSSDAADALQLLAGAPVSLNVTALRREEPAADAAGVADPALALDPATPVTGLGPAAVIEATPLDPIVGAAAIEAAEAAPVAVEATPPPVESVTSDLQRPFIQIGIFSVEANADGAAADLDANGLPSRVVEGQTQGRTFWRVLVGPATTEAQREALLTQVKAEGFADAYFVSN